MELRLLGPLEVLVNGRALDLGGPRLRLVLSLLALNAGQVTPIEYLLDNLWGADPPSTARGQIQICISQLRKLFTGNTAASIHTRAPGYLLELRPGTLDIEMFHQRTAAGRAHAAEGRLPEAVADLRAALALWRGPALAGVEAEAIAREATRLEEERAAVLAERLRLDLSLGRHQELTGELRALVAKHPLREHLHALLMLTLYRCGRQAEALEAGRQARAALAEEVGVDPGPELQEMERAILVRNPALGRPDAELPMAETAAPPASPTLGEPEPPVTTSAPRQLPLSISDFTGRADQLAEVIDALTGGRDPYALPVVTLSGPGGVGKSSLAVRAAHELAAAFPDGQLYADLHEPGPGDAVARQLERFLHALGVPAHAVPDDRSERIELYRSRLAGRRLLVLLDGAGTQEQVLSLLPGNPACAVLVTSRVPLTGLPGTHHVAVGELDAEAAAGLLTEIVGADRTAGDPESVRQLVAACDGLPLALRVAGARLASRPHWSIHDLVRRLAYENRRLDELAHNGLAVRPTIATTYEDLGAKARRLFRRCALVLAPGFPAWTAAALLGTGTDDAEDVLEELVDAQLVTVTMTPGEHRRYAMPGLVRVFSRERLAEEDEADRRDAQRRFLGGWLSLSDAAHRAAYGGDDTRLVGPAARWNPPGTALADLVTDASTWWQRERIGLVAAIRQAAELGEHETAWDLLFAGLTPFETYGWYDDWRESAQLAVEVTEAAGDRRGLAVARYARGSLALARKQLPAAQQEFTAALEIFTELGDPHGRGLTLRNLAFVSRVHGEAGRAAEDYAAALSELRTAGDRVGEAHTLSGLARVWMDDGDRAGARDLLDRAVRLCQEAGCLRVEAMVMFRLAELHLDAAELGEARQALHRTLRVVRDLGDRTGEAYALVALGQLRHREGRWEAAHTTFDSALQVASERGERWAEGQARFGLGEVTLVRGEPGTAAEHLRAAVEVFADLRSALWHAKSLIVLAEALAAAGQPGDAHGRRALELLDGLDSGEAGQWTARARQAVSPSERHS